MRGDGFLMLATVAFTSVAAGSAVSLLMRPLPRLRRRIERYTVRYRSGTSLLDRHRADSAAQVVGAVFGRPLVAVAQRIRRSVDREREERLALELRRSGLFPGASAEQRVLEYRVRLTGSVAGGALLAALMAVLLSTTAATALALAAVGGIAGGSRWRGRVGRAVESRRLRMRLELVTVNQLLALRVRSGAGVASALREMVQRGHGDVLGELREVLALHQAGVPLAEALRRAARATAEPQASRTYSVLATAEERGADLATALLAIGEDLRVARRESVRQVSTRRRFMMLIPIVLFLAPVMILFVATPLPFVVLGGR